MIRTVLAVSSRDASDARFRQAHLDAATSAWAIFPVRERPHQTPRASRLPSTSPPSRPRRRHGLPGNASRRERERNGAAESRIRPGHPRTAARSIDRNLVTLCATSGNWKSPPSHCAADGQLSVKLTHSPAAVLAAGRQARCPGVQFSLGTTQRLPPAARRTALSRSRNPSSTAGSRATNGPAKSCAFRCAEGCQRSDSRAFRQRLRNAWKAFQHPAETSSLGGS